MDYKLVLLKYCRPKFYKLCESTDCVNDINSQVLDLLIESVATIKIAVKEQFANIEISESKELKYLGNKFDFKYLSKIETFAGYNYVIQYNDQKILLKCFSNNKAFITRNLLQELIKILQTKINANIFHNFCVIVESVIENELCSESQYRFQEIAIIANTKVSNKQIVIPQLIPTFFCQNIVPMEWLSGKPFFSYKELDLTESYKNELLRLNYTLINDYGILRYDFHFSNYLSLHDNKIALLDYGSILELQYLNKTGNGQSAELIKWVQTNIS